MVEAGYMEKFPSIVSDIMSSPVITLTGEVNVRDAALLMTDKRIESIVVTERGKPIGIVTGRDIIERIACPCEDPCEVKMKEIMTSPVITIFKDTTILDAMRKMRGRNISRLVVIDGDIEGIISESDVIRAVSIASLTSFSTLLQKSR
jgi:CBS domain-containing protein